MQGGQSGDNLETIWRQSGDNLETIWRQSGDNLETVWRQSGDNLETIWRQSGDAKLCLVSMHIHKSSVTVTGLLIS